MLSDLWHGRITEVHHNPEMECPVSDLLVQGDLVSRGHEGFQIRISSLQAVGSLFWWLIHYVIILLFVCGIAKDLFFISSHGESWRPVTEFLCLNLHHTCWSHSKNTGKGSRLARHSQPWIWLLLSCPDYFRTDYHWHQTPKEMTLKHSDRESSCCFHFWDFKLNLSLSPSTNENI